MVLDVIVDEVGREEKTLRAVRAEVGHELHEAVWMLTLVIEQLRAETQWLEKLQHDSSKRAPAKHAKIVSRNTK